MPAKKPTNKSEEGDVKPRKAGRYSKDMPERLRKLYEDSLAEIDATAEQKESAFERFVSGFAEKLKGKDTEDNRVKASNKRSGKRKR